EGRDPLPAAPRGAEVTPAARHPPLAASPWAATRGPMTEAPDWFTAAEPDPLLRVVWPILPSAAVGVPPPGRRLRLFGVACARQVWDLLPTDACSAVLISERFADGRATETDLRAAAVWLVPGPVTVTQHALNAAGYASTSLWELDNQRPSIDPL